MTLAEECDAAEVVWGALADRQDMLRLLAGLLGRQGVRGLRDYDPPSAQLQGMLAAPAEEPRTAETRQRDVLRFVTGTGGEAG